MKLYIMLLMSVCVVLNIETQYVYKFEMNFNSLTLLILMFLLIANYVYLQFKRANEYSEKQYICINKPEAFCCYENCNESCIHYKH